MRCPRCQHEYRLTLREYFRRSWAGYRCPACGTGFRLKLTVSYLLLLALACIIAAAVPAFLAYYYWGSAVLGLVTYLACAAVFVLPLDLLLDDRWREPKEL